MTIKEFLNFAKDCKTKPELASLAKSNGIDLKKDELNNGIELSFDELESAAGGNTYGMDEQTKQRIIN